MTTADEVSIALLAFLAGVAFLSIWLSFSDARVHIVAMCGPCNVDGEFCSSHPKAPVPHKFICVNQEWEGVSP